MHRARWPRRSTELSLNEKQLDRLRDLEAEVLNGVIQAARHGDRREIRRDTDVHNHPGGIQALSDFSGGVRIPGVEALHGLLAGAHDEFRSRCTEGDAVAQDAIS